MSDVLAGRASTFSKGPEFWSGDPTFEPREVRYGCGARIIGRDHREYLDWVSGLGAISLGYPNSAGMPGVDDDMSSPADHWAGQVAGMVWEGAGFSLPHMLERQVAEKLTAMLQAHVPGWQGQPLGLRWGKTGSDACSAAVRLARAVKTDSISSDQRQQKIINVGYHGWGSEFIGTTPPAWGIPEVNPDVAQAVNFGDLEFLAQLLENGNVAAVIIEQPPQTPPDGYWAEVQRLCREHGALLIVDEVVTGLRFGLGGACERFGIQPDIIAMGKALGNGLPVSCIVGRREYWSWLERSDPVFISSTHFGEAVGLAAANAMLDCWDEKAVDHVWGIGQHLMGGLRGVGINVVGYPPVSLCQFGTPSERAFFVREMARKGILINRPNIPNLAHTLADVRQTVEAAGEVMAEMQKVDVEAEMAGKLPAVLFSNR